VGGETIAARADNRVQGANKVPLAKKNKMKTDENARNKNQ
jgi:hypothetical protein